MNPVLIIRILSAGLILLFTFGILAAAYGFSGQLLFAALLNIGFVVGGIGLFRMKRWGWWLTLGLCAASIIQLLWQLLTKLTPQTATDLNEMVSFIVAGFYLAIVFVLTCNPVRKAFREHSTNK